MKAAAKFSFLLFVPALLAGCGPDPRRAVEARAHEAFHHLAHDELDALVEMTDPGYVRAHGTAGVKLKSALLAGLFKLSKLTENDVRIDQVALGPDRKTADVGYSLRSGTDWRPQQPLRWVLVDNQWYLKD